MKTFIRLIIIILVYTGCAENAKQQKADTVAVTDKVTNTPVPATGCRQMLIGKDTAYLSLQESGDSLYGTLEYKRFEKDSNTGTVHLVKRNSRAEGWYNYKSEGMNSVRQIIFEMKGDTLSEAFGDIVMRGDTAMYKYPHALQFEEKHSFVRTNCK